MKTLLMIFAAISLLSLGACTHGHAHKKPGDKKSCSHSKKHGKKMEKKMKKWTAMDKNADGAISKKEFDTAHADMFKAMDTNKDGKVTMDEKKAYMKAKCGCK